MIVVGAHERELDQGNELGGSATRSPSIMPGFDPGTCYAFTTHSDQQQGLTNVQAP